MTGLDLNKDVLVEIAVLVTDSQLNVLGEGVDLVIRASQEQLDGMNDFVRQMHTDSGLITEIPGGVELEEAQTQILVYLNKYAPGAGKSRSPETPSRSTVALSTATSQNWPHTFITGRSMSARSKSWPAAGTRRSTSAHRRRLATTVHWVIFAIRSMSWITTAARYFSPHEGLLKPITLSLCTTPWWS
jgi:hypothetical protein